MGLLSKLKALFLRKRAKSINVSEEELGEIRVTELNTFGNASPKGGIGKTTIQLELGTMLLLEGKSVVFVDWDIMSPRLSLRLLREIPPGPSLVKVLLDRVEITEAVREALISGKRGAVRAKVVPAVADDDVPDNLNALLDMMNDVGSLKKLISRMKDSITKLAKEYYVLFNDYPVPSWAAYQVYQKLLGRTSYWVNLLSDPTPNMIQLVGSLHKTYSTGNKILGVVINMVRPTISEITSAKENAEKLCRDVNAYVAIVVPFDGKLYDVFAGGLASPATLNYDPDTSPALRQIMKFKEYIENARNGKLVYEGCKVYTPPL